MLSGAQNVILLSIAALVFSIWAGIIRSNERELNSWELLKHLRKVRDATKPRSKEARVALGYNVCLDAVVNVFDLFTAAQVTPPEQPKDFSDIKSKDQLAKTFLLHFEKSAGGERAVSDPDTFSEIETSLNKVSHEKHLGGNAAIMAVVLSRDFGFEHVLLGGQVGPEIQALLPKSIQTVALESGEHLIGEHNVLVRDDETHIILEYEKGSSWGQPARKVTAERANRFIISHDMSNAVLAPLEPLNNHIASAKVPYDVLVAAGFHMLDVASEEFRTVRMKNIVESLKAIPKETRVHFELASIGDPNLLKGIASLLLPVVDSVGLNEQELGALYQAMGLNTGSSAVKMDLLTRTIPDVELVCLVLETILTLLNKNKIAHRVLSRIHFHSFGFHIIAQYSSDGGAENWPNMISAVAAGSVKASERACNTTDLTPEDISFQLGSKLVKVSASVSLELSSNYSVLDWKSKDGNVSFALAPVLTCNKPTQTVGLGDSISAAALAYQI